MSGNSGESVGIQRFGDLVIDHAAREVTLNGQSVGLTPAEFALLSTLASRAGQAISSRDLLEAMWGSEWSTDTTALQVHVSRLRAKLGERGRQSRLIVTVHGLGYRFEPQSAPTGEPDLSIDSPRSVELVYGADLFLRAVSPHEPFLGYDPDDIIGTFFSPAGLDEVAVRAVLEAMARNHVPWTEGQVLVAEGGGSTVTVTIRSTVTVDENGEISGFVTVLTLPG